MNALTNLLLYLAKRYVNMSNNIAVEIQLHFSIVGEIAKKIFSFKNASGSSILLLYYFLHKLIILILIMLYIEDLT